MFLTPRKVGRHHLAFYRGWLQGLDLKTLADQYLETGLDLRLTKATLSWLRDTLSQAALRHGRYQEARLLRLYLKPRANEQTLAFPSLEAFQEEVDPEGEYSEEELIRWYFETFPQALDRKIRQRRRLMERQLAALSWIEPLLAAEPVPEDVVSAWFDPKLAERLILAGLPTLGVQAIQEVPWRLRRLLFNACQRLFSLLFHPLERVSVILVFSHNHLLCKWLWLGAGIGSLQDLRRLLNDTPLFGARCG